MATSFMKTDLILPLALLLAAPSTWLIAWFIYSERARSKFPRRH